MHKFKFYYGHLPSLQITNVISPGKRHVHPGNGNFVNQRKFEEYCQGYHDRLENDSNFYSRLAKDVRTNGIKNPILVHSGYCIQIYRKYLPKGNYTPNEEILCTDRNGGSRLWIAQNFNMTVPVLIADCVGRFDGIFEELCSIEQIKSKFTDSETVEIIFNQHGLNVGKLPNPYLKKV